MAQFDDYFAQSLAKAREEQALPNLSQIDALLAKKQQENDELTASKLRGAAELQRRKYEQDNSAASQLGLDPDGVLYQGVNNSVAMWNGATNIAADVVSAPADVYAAMNERNVPIEVQEAWFRHTQGQASDQDREILNYRFSPETTDTFADVMQRSENARTFSQLAQERGHEMEGAFDGGNRARLDDDLYNNSRQGFQDLDNGKYVSGIWELVKAGGAAALNNPAAIGEYIAEMTPDLAAGVFGGLKGVTAVSMAYGVDTYREGRESFQEKYGRPPTDDEEQAIMGWAMAAAAADFVGDTALLKPLGFLNGTKAAQKVSNRIAGKMADTKLASAFSAAQKIPGKTIIKTAATEASTEAFQTYAENEAASRDTSGFDLFKSATIGGASGGGIATAGAIPRGAAKAADAAEKAVENRAKAAAETEQFNEAVESGDTSKYLDSSSESYSPEKAAAVLHKRSQDKELPEEDRNQAKTELDTLLNSLGAQEASLQGDIDLLSSDTNEPIQKKIENLKDLIDKTEDADTKEQYEALLEIRKQQLAEYDGLTPEGRQSLIKTKEGEIQELRNIVDSVAEKTVDTPVSTAPVSESTDVKDLVSTIKSRDTDTSTTDKAVGQLVASGMVSPASITDVELESLVNDTGNGMSDSARSTLRRFTEGRVAYHAMQNMDTVQTSDIMGTTRPNSATGTSMYRSIPQYQKMIKSAVAQKDQKAIKRLEAELTGFQRNQANKHKAAKQALEQIKALDAPSGSDWRYLIPQDGGNWEVTGKRPNVKDPSKHGIWSTKAASPAHIKALENLIEYTGAASTALDGLSVALETSKQNLSDVSPAAKKLKTEAKKATEQKQQDTQKAQEPIVEDRQITDEYSDWASQIDGQSEYVENKVPVDQQPPNSTETQQEPTQSDEDQYEKATQIKKKTPKKENPNSKKHTENNREVHKELSDTERFDQEISQNAGSQKQGSQRPLVAQDNFVGDGLTAEKAKSVLKDDEISPKQETYLKVFGSTVQKWLPSLEALLGDNEATDYDHKNPVQVKMNKEGDLPDNWKTAIIYGAISFMNENSGKNFTGEDTIRLWTGKYADGPKGQVWITPEEYKLFGTAKEVEFLAVSSIGQKISSVLGLQSKDADSDPAYLSRLETALGTYAVSLLVDQGVIYKRNISSEHFNPDWLEKGSFTEQEVIRDKVTGEVKEVLGEKAKLTMSFLQFNKNWETPVESLKDGYRPFKNKTTDALYQASKETGAILDRVFTADKVDSLPSFTSGAYEQETAKKSDQKVSTTQTENNKKVSERIHTLQQDVFTVIDGLTDEVLIRINGGQSDGYIHHATNVERYQSQVADTQRSIDNLRNFADVLRNRPSGLKSVFYFVPQVWRQFRVGLSSSTVNIQTDKLHRAAISMAKNQTTIKLKDGKAKDKEKLRVFKLAVGQALGMDMDKQSNRATYKDFDAEFARIKNEPDSNIAMSVRGLQSLMSGGKMSPDQTEALIALTSSKEKFHTLNGLMHLARYHQAVESGADTFKTDITIEVDGVTNGPALGKLALGATDLKEAEAFGIFSEGTQYKDFPNWASNPANLDLYKKVAKRILVAQLQVNVDDAIKKTVNSIAGLTIEDGTALTPTKKARGVVKTPTTAMSFGAGLDKTTGEDMFNEFIGQIYSNIEAVLNQTDSETQATDFQAIHDQLVQLGLSKESVPTDAAFKDFVLSNNDLKVLRKPFMSVIGLPAQKALKEQFEAFIDARKVLSETSTTLHDLYTKAKATIEQRYINELMDNGEMPYIISENAYGKQTRIPQKGLSKSQKAELRKRLAPVLPIVHTAFSSKDGELEAGYQIGKMGRKSTKSDKRSPYNGQVTLGESVPKGQRNKRIYGTQIVDEAPGASTLIGLIHAMDSYIASMSYGALDATNIHDALLLGIKDAFKGAKTLNRNTFKVLMDYSIPMEMAAATERMIEGYKELNMVIPAKVKRDLEAMQKQARVMEIQKLKLLQQVGFVNQYGLDGGSYTPTATDKKNIAAKLAALIAEQPAEKSATTKKPQQPKPKTPAQKTAGTMTVWGELGKSTTAPDTGLEQILKDSPNGTFKELYPKFLAHAQAMAKGLEGNEKSREEKYVRLLKSLKDVVPADLPFTYVTAKSSMPGPMFKDRAIYQRHPATHLRNVGEQDLGIYIKSSEYRNSVITLEMLTHELVHAATSVRLDQLSKDDQLYKDIKELHKKAKDKVAEFKATNPTHPDLYIMEYALQDLHEFIAVGLTNGAFKTYILAEIEMDTEAKVPKSGLKAFVDWVVEILSKGLSKSHKEVMRSGLIHLMAATTDLTTRPITSQSNGRDIAAQGMAVPVREFTHQDVYDSLVSEDVSPTTRDYHKKLLNRVVTTVLGTNNPWADQYDASTIQHPEDYYLKAKELGLTPFSSEAAHHFGLGTETAFVAENMELALREALHNDSATYRQVRKMYAEARKLPAETFGGQDAKDFLFRAKQSGEATSDYLSRFVAIVLADPKIREGLNKERIQKPDVPANESLWDRMVRVFNDAMNHLSRLFMGVSGTSTIGHRLEALTLHTAGVKAKRRRHLESKTGAVFDTLESMASYAESKIKSGASKLATSEAVRESRFSLVRAVGSSADLLVNNSAQDAYEGIKKSRDLMFKNTQLGVTSSLLNEVMTQTDANRRFYALSRESNKIEQERKAESDRLQEIVTDWFNGESEPTVEEWKAITRIGLKLDLASLSDAYNLEHIGLLLQNPTELKAEIKKIEKRILKRVPRDVAKAYITDARSLGLFLATGEVGTEMLRQNAHQIAHQMGERKSQRAAQQYADANKQDINMLATLHGIQHAPMPIKTAFNEVFNREANKTEGRNGVEQLLKLHKLMQQDALQVNFDGNPTQMAKGYTRENYNQHIDVEVVDLDETASKKAEGFEVRHLIGQDSSDSNAGTDKVLMTRYGGGLRRYVSGAVSMTGLRKKGTPMSDLNRKFTGRTKQQDINEVTKRKLTKHSPSVGYRPEVKAKDGAALVPVFNDQGTITDWRYMMLEQHKDELLERNNQAHVVLGNMAGHAYDKVAAADLNRTIIDALHMQYQEDIGLRDNAYIVFGPNSSDPEIRETYNLLPESTKQYIKEVWGGNNLQIRNDLYDMVFGYRARSIVGNLQQAANDPERQKSFMGVVASTLEQFGLFSPKAIYRMRQGEDIWQEVITALKDNVVIKNVVTLQWNILSNTVLLWNLGVPITDIAKYHAEGIKGIIDYRKDTKELHATELAISMGLTGNELYQAKQKVIELKDAIERNPVKELIDAGMLQTIVEDVTTGDDEFSYSSALIRKLDEKTQGLPKSLKTAGKYLFVSHDTEIYKVLSNSTHYSDFVARYALHKHMTTRKKNPMSKQESLDLAMEAFINYDIPTHRNIQYMNDMGLLMFTKYFLRIQHVIMHLWREQPARSLITILISNYLADLQTVFDSSIVGRLGNPLEDGIFGYPESVSEIFTIKLLTD